MKVSSVLCCAVVVVLLAAQADGQTLSDLIKQAFAKDSMGSGASSSSSEDAPSEGVGGEDGSQCECVPVYQCSDNGSVIDNGIGLIDIRFGSSPSSRSCTCTANNNEGIRDDRPCSDYLDVCCKVPTTEKVSPKPPTSRLPCGERHPDGVGFRIIGDEDNESQFGEFPWMIAVMRDQNEKRNVYQCGGSLIHPSVVLTAGHCVVGKKPESLRIRAGEWDTQTRNELFAHQDRNVSKVIVHRDYYAGALYNDVALLILETPVELIDNVDVICLPSEGDALNETNCVVSGWGKDVFGKEGSYQVILKKVELPLVPNPLCQEKLRTTRLGKFFNLHESFVCAGGIPGRDACKGDGGSPLVCQYRDDPRRYQQVGIVAWGIGCGGDIPGVYANIPLFKNWIRDQLRKNDIDIAPYEYSNTENMH